MEGEVLYEERARGGSAWAEITLDRPQKGNALTLPMLNAIEGFMTTVEASRTIRAVVLRGNGRFFCTGGDIEAWGSMSSTAMANDWILRGIEVLDKIAALPQPVIAAISGHALGGGLELAMRADLRVGVEEAKLGMPEVGLGMISGWGGVRRLSEIIGVSRARELTLLGLPITAEKAHAWGLLHAVAKDTVAMEEQIDAWLEELLMNAPIAMALTKGLLATLHANLDQFHADATAEARATEDCDEGIAAFRSKREPDFRNR
jgi:enoyl-CoA hydratase/carnithine racemase